MAARAEGRQGIKYTLRLFVIRGWPASKDARARTRTWPSPLGIGELVCRDKILRLQHEVLWMASPEIWTRTELFEQMSDNASSHTSLPPSERQSFGASMIEQVVSDPNKNRLKR